MALAIATPLRVENVQAAATIRGQVVAVAAGAAGVEAAAVAAGLEVEAGGMPRLRRRCKGGGTVVVAAGRVVTLQEAAAHGNLSRLR